MTQQPRLRTAQNLAERSLELLRRLFVKEIDQVDPDRTEPSLGLKPHLVKLADIDVNLVIEEQFFREDAKLRRALDELGFKQLDATPQRHEELGFTRLARFKYEDEDSDYSYYGFDAWLHRLIRLEVWLNAFGKQPQPSLDDIGGRIPKGQTRRELIRDAESEKFMLNSKVNFSQLAKEHSLPYGPTIRFLKAAHKLNLTKAKVKM